MPLWLVIVLALLPLAGSFAGGMLAERMEITKRQISIALHATASIVFAVVGVELMPRTLESTNPWIVVLTFCLGTAATGFKHAVNYSSD